MTFRAEVVFERLGVGDSRTGLSALRFRGDERTGVLGESVAERGRGLTGPKNDSGEMDREKKAQITRSN